MMSVVFEKDGVFIQSQPQYSLQGGRIRIEETSQRGPLVVWLSADYEDEDDSIDPGYGDVVTVTGPPSSADWTMVTSMSFKKSDLGDTVSPGPLSNRKLVNDHNIVRFGFNNLKSVKRSSPTQGWASLTFTLRDGSSLPEFAFHNGGSREMMRGMAKYVSMKRSFQDRRLFNVAPHNREALSESFNELSLFDVDTSSNLVTRFFNDPVPATLASFSKVKDLVWGRGPTHRSPPQTGDPAFPLEPPPNPPDLKEFELVSRPDLDLGPDIDVVRGPTISLDRWMRYSNPATGLDRSRVLDSVFRGGLREDARNEGWKFLLGYIPWNVVGKEREEHVKQRQEFYYSMKLQWKSMTPEQEYRNQYIRERKSLIEKDVMRTDRTHSHYSGENSPNLATLHDVLMTYCMYDFDLGYVQGMSDLLSVILVVQREEVDTFWCFVGLMERIHRNFEIDQTGMRTQLDQLNLLINHIDPALYDYLERKESSNLFFCFRWLLILFKREFSFPDTMLLWEVLFTDLPCKNFHLLFSLAILLQEKDTMISKNYGFNEILKHINELSMRLDVESILVKAESLFLQLQQQSHNLPVVIKEILHFSLEDLDEPQSESDNPSSGNDDDDDVVNALVGGAASLGLDEHTL